MSRFDVEREARDPTQAEKPTCPHCGSDDLVADATVWWTGEAWEISDGEYTEGTCNVCERSDVVFVWVPL